ncbi:MAG: DUF4339 domain-containing protein [Planctomycetes bacterium]|nr:DUF4339 domain-containing protein [Planctomycetota bacterium]
MELGIQFGIGAVFGTVTAILAHSRGRNTVGWFFIGFLTGCIGLIILLCISDLKEEKAKWQAAEQRQRRLSEQLRQEKLKTQTFREHVVNRLDVHDKALNMDTKQLGGDEQQNLLLNASKSNEELMWYYICREKQVGPVSFTDLQIAYRGAIIDANSLIWNETFTDWLVLSKVPGLKEQLQ